MTINSESEAYKKWELVAKQILSNSPLKGIPSVENNLIRFGMRLFKEKNKVYTHIESPFMDARTHMAWNVALHSSPDAVNDYIATIAKEVVQLMGKEVLRLEVQAKKCYNLKIVDKIYNPIYNRIGYTLESGDVVFTDEAVLESTHELNTTNIMRKINLSDLLED